MNISNRNQQAALELQLQQLQSPQLPSARRRRNYEVPATVTPTMSPSSSFEEEDEASNNSDDDAKNARQKLNTKVVKKLCFGHNISCESTVLDKTRNVYKVVNKMTGSIGGNGHGGAIYGELTVGSMQKMIDLMKVHTNFGPESRFIDVGSGLGKPNLHVTQDPGVEFSYGIEMEKVRWVLGMSNLNMVLQHAENKPSDGIRHQCAFHHGDITDAKYFDPFTHVYMFDIG